LNQGRRIQAGPVFDRAAQEKALRSKIECGLKWTTRQPALARSFLSENKKRISWEEAEDRIKWGVPKALEPQQVKQKLLATGNPTFSYARLEGRRKEILRVVPVMPHPRAGQFDLLLSARWQ